MAEITLFVAFLAGLVSFLSPCILPLIPAFLSYLAGTSFSTRKPTKSDKIKIFVNSFLFVAGFSTVFSILGVLLNTALSNISFEVQTWLSRIGGAIIIAFGFYLLGLIKIPFLEQEHKIKVKKMRYTYLTSYVFGASFAVGWTPCVGAVLGSIFALAVSTPTNALALLFSYSIGLGIPFLVTGIFTSQTVGLINKYGTALKYFNIVIGILLLVLGVLVFTNNLNQVSNFASAFRILT